MIKIKICGIQYKEEIEFLNLLKPDYIGFVFATSKRQIDYYRAKALKAYLHPTIETVGVFVNHNIDEIIQLAEEGIIDLVQLHGNEDKGYIENLKRYIRLPLIKAIQVGEKIELPDVDVDVDYYLLDKKSERSHGGTGKCFDWRLLGNTTKPYFLAGGIGLENIDEALSYSPYSIDLSSKIEIDGKKDMHKVKEVIEKVRKRCG
nr:phosphoribosylanthranilate isomerase [uncultured Niameybacter sp.]